MIDVEIVLPDIGVIEAFPKLMELKSNSGDIIVLFNTDNSGIVIQSWNSDWKSGDYSDIFNIKQFKKFNGKIILQNKEI